MATADIRFWGSAIKTVLLKTPVNTCWQLYVIHYTAKTSKNTICNINISGAVSLYMRLCKQLIKKTITEAANAKQEERIKRSLRFFQIMQCVLSCLFLRKDVLGYLVVNNAFKT